MWYGPPSSEVPIMRAFATPAAAGLLLVSLACGGSSASDGDVTLSTVPTPPDYVSGGDVLLRVDVASSIALDRVTLSVNGGSAVVVQAPAPPDRLGRAQHALLAKVEGLVLGANEVVASVDGDQAATLVVTNYPIEGPIFSGEHLEPYFCLDQLAPTARGPSRFAIGNGDFLDGSGHGEGCSLETRVDYLYMPTGDGAELQPLASLTDPPPGLATTTTSEG